VQASYLNLLFANLAYRGGIRGIAELEVLAELERALGGEIPIRSFFDLLVGTRYGFPSLHMICVSCLVRELRGTFQHWRHHSSWARGKGMADC
jgi:hypothetical protein